MVEEDEEWPWKDAEIRDLCVEVERLKAQLPDGMKDCTITFHECAKGHGRLSAKNWVKHGCPTCEIQLLRGLLAEALVFVLDALDPYWLAGRIQKALHGPDDV